MSLHLFEHRGKVRYAAPIPRTALRDGRLSFGARGLFAFLWDLPEDWSPCLKHLQQMSHAGYTAIRSLVRELEEVKALTYEECKNPQTGRFEGTRWVMHAPEIWAIELPLNGEAEHKPRAENPTAFRKKDTKNRSTTPSHGKSDSRKNQSIGFSVTKGKASKRVDQVNVFACSAKKSPTNPPRLRTTLHGVSCWTPEDREKVFQLLEEHGTEQFNKAVAEIKTAGRDPLPSRVETQLNRIHQSSYEDRYANPISTEEYKRAEEALGFSDHGYATEFGCIIDSESCLE